MLTRLVVCPCCVTIGAFLSRLPQLAPSLTYLDLSGCGGLSGADLQQLLAQIKGLERLLLDGIEEVGGIVTMLAGSGGVQLKYGLHQQSDAQMYTNNRMHRCSRHVWQETPSKCMVTHACKYEAGSCAACGKLCGCVWCKMLSLIGDAEAALDGTAG